MRAISAAMRAPNSACVLSPVPTAVPPIARRYRPGSAASIAWRERRRVLQVRAPDLDDRCEFPALRLQRRREAVERGNHVHAERARRGNVHRRGEHVVGRLAEIDVVVGMQQALRAALAAEQLGGAVGQHLVGVHVRLRAGARLPDHQRELLVVPAREHLVGGARQRLAGPARREEGGGDRARRSA
jgi:hypothetical protein